MSSVVSTVSRLFRSTLSGGENDRASSSNEVTRLLLAGPVSSGKTSLLFEYAISYAEQGETVLFIAPKPISRLPLFVNGRSQPKPGTLKLINFVYLSTSTEFIDFFSRVHLSKSRSSYGRPKHVLIDDFDSYFREKCSRTDDTTRIAKCLAYIIDGVEYFSKIQAGDDVKTKLCSLLVAETALGESQVIERQGLYKHWIKDFLRIRITDQHLFEMKHIGCRTGATVSSDLGVYYQVSQKGIELVEDESL